MKKKTNKTNINKTSGYNQEMQQSSVLSTKIINDRQKKKKYKSGNSRLLH